MPKGVKNVTPVTETPADGLLAVPSTQDVPLAQAELSPTTAGEETATAIEPVNGTVESLPSVEAGRQSGKSELVIAEIAQAAGLIDAFLAWAKSDEDMELDPFVVLGLLNADHSLSDAGVDLLDNNAIAWRTINFLTLGTPVTFDVDGGKHTVNAGSMLRLIHNGQDKDGQVFSVCDVGEFLPQAVIYKNHLHIYSSARYPLTQPLTTSYETAS